MNAQSGVTQGTRQASLKEYKMAIPNDKLMRKFEEKIIPQISSIKYKDKENDHLASLRDTLLPRLMSGELKVNEIVL